METTISPIVQTIKEQLEDLGIKNLPFGVHFIQVDENTLKCVYFRKSNTYYVIIQYNEGTDLYDVICFNSPDFGKSTTTSEISGGVFAEDLINYFI